MSVERFTKEQFESALPVNKHTGQPMWKPLGVIAGYGKNSYCYIIEIDDQVGIFVRSSVKPSGS